MAKIPALRLLRARLADLRRSPWTLLLLFAGDLVELGASLALAVLSPPPAVHARVPYPAFEVPVAPQALTLGVAFIGVTAGLFMGAAILAELVVMFRRAQIFRWKYGSTRLRARASLPMAR